MVLSESEYAHFVGRVYGDDQSGYTISNTASGIEFATDSRNVYITLSGSQAPEGDAYVNVLIDNERVKRMEIGSQKKEYSLYVNRDQKVHTVKVLKATEAQYSSLVLYAVRGDGYFYPVTEKSQRKIEFYGDSITCGYANIGDSSVKTYRTQDQDGTQTYAYFCADKLHTEIDVLAATAWSVNKSKWARTDIRPLRHIKRRANSSMPT